jgi:hypothetical protein
VIAGIPVDVNNTLAVIVVAISVVTGLGGIAATVFSFGRVKSVESTLAIMRSENDALQDAYRGLQARTDSERASCAEQLAELRGRLDLLTSQFTFATATAIAAAVREISGGPIPPITATPHLRRSKTTEDPS